MKGQTNDKTLLHPVSKQKDSFSSVFCVYVSKSEKKRPLRLEAASFSESSTVAAWFSTDADITEENHNALRKAVTIMQQHQCIDAKAPLLAKTLLLPLSKLWFSLEIMFTKKCIFAPKSFVLSIFCELQTEDGFLKQLFYNLLNDLLHHVKCVKSNESKV